MKSSWNADRADFLITSGVWNMTSIQELFITGSVVFASRLVNFQHQQEIAAFSDEIIITSAGKGSGALITAQYGEKYHRKIWIITNDRKSSV